MKLFLRLPTSTKKPDTLTSEDGAEIDLLAIEADAPACGHGDGSVVERVIEVWQAPVGTR